MRKSRHRGREGSGGEIYSKAVIDLIRSNLTADDIASAKALGVSVPGPYDPEKGELIHSPNLLFPVVPIKAPLENEFHKPVFVMNDCNCGVLGEVGIDGAGGADVACGAEDGEGAGDHSDRNNVVYVSMSTGIGCGVIADGRLLLGNTGNAGEVGHLFVDGTYSVKCSCNHIGHWEGYASGRGIPHFFRAYCRGNKIPMNCSAILPTAADIFAGIKEELKNTESGADSDAAGADGCGGFGVFAGFYEELSKVNARAVSSIIAAYSPAVIILDGSVAMNNGELIIAGILKYIDRYLPTPEIRLSRLEGKAPLYGAAYNCALSLGRQQAPEEK